MDFLELLNFIKIRSNIRKLQNSELFHIKFRLFYLYAQNKGYGTIFVLLLMVRLI